MPEQQQSVNFIERKLNDLHEEFVLDNERLHSVVEIMNNEMEKGLIDSYSGSSLAMLCSYVSSLPSGEERGCYMALDLGGTNFRVLLVRIKACESGGLVPRVEMMNQLFMVPDDVKRGNAETFFDHIANCMLEFCENNGITDTYLPVGFTFSFPLKQEGINSANLLRWTKGFDVSGVVGEDVVRLLHEALERQGGLNCEVVAVVNDTVGTMMSCALTEPDCHIGLIVGTGLNACYMEKASNVKSCNVSEELERMCINMELGGFGDNGVIDHIRSEYDEKVDGLSHNKNSYVFEKMISGKYLGEVVRVILCDLTEEYGLFNGEGSKKLFTENSFLTSFVSEIEGSFGKASHLNEVRNILSHLNIDASDADCEVVRRVCHIVSVRAAYLSAAGVAAIAKRIQQNRSEESKKITVGVDGTMYKKLPRFNVNLQSKVQELVRNDITIDFVLSHDGSGKGAAVIAAAMTSKK